jgi:hypothetical protein
MKKLKTPHDHHCPIRQSGRLLGFGAILLALGGGVSVRAANSVGKTAWHIVRSIRGNWYKMPGDIHTSRMVGAPLIGNGGLGVAMDGRSRRQVYFIGRDGFWSVLRGRIMPMGQLHLKFPSLAHASAHMDEAIGKAYVGGHFVRGHVRLLTRSWTRERQNVVAVELKNVGSAPIPVAASLVDVFGQHGLHTNAGTSGTVQWLKVSPEVVRATIGRKSAWPQLSKFDGHIRSLIVLNAYVTDWPTAAHPVYRWSSPHGLLAGHHGFSCGDIIMPQKHFTVSAAINVQHAGIKNAIFSAAAFRWMRREPLPADPFGNAPGPHLPREQGSLAGFVMYLSKGRLAANLNGTVVMSAHPIPLDHWEQVTASYNGRQLILLVNGKLEAESRVFSSAAQVMGPKWDWAATHPGDRHLPYDDCGPTGVLALRVVGVVSTYDDGATYCVIPPGKHATILLAAMDDRDSPTYLKQAISRLQNASDGSIRAAWQRHVAWWRHFWSKSYIEIPDKTVQAWWYGSLYVLASCSGKGHTATGLWGDWTTSPAMGWQGDYTLDYNYEAPFWAAYPTNHVSLADPYDAPLLAWMQRGRGLAHHLHDHGLIYLCHLAPSPVWSADNWRSNDHKANALFAAVDCVQRWSYTRSTRYAKEILPFLSGVADFWDHDLKLVHGKYVDFGDAADEVGQGVSTDVNPATTIGFLRLLYPALIHMSLQMHIDARQRRQWQHVLKHLSGLPISPARDIQNIRAVFGSHIPAGAMVIRETLHGKSWIAMGNRFKPNAPIQATRSSGGMNAAQAIFPAWNVGIESPAPIRHAALNTIYYMQTWYDANDNCTFYPAAADAGYNPESILKHLHLLVTHIGFPNFAYNLNQGGIENEATVPTTICAMFLQSYQRNIHVFANWPGTDNASFGHLLACGDFLVSSAIRHGVVTFVGVKSVRGGRLRLVNPWPELNVDYTTSTGNHGVLRGKVLSIGMTPEEDIRLAPKN